MTTFAVHTVFIVQENILFLEEWVNYHKLLGFTKFYLYDNSKCVRPGHYDKNNCPLLQLGKINKHGVNYKEYVSFSDSEIQDMLFAIVKKYGLVLVEWSPLDKAGLVTYGQRQAHAHCLKRLKRDGVDWCANIDMDEYIVIKHYANIQEYVKAMPNTMSNIHMMQVRFESRFSKKVDALVTSINRCVAKAALSKNIYRVSHTNRMGIHRWFGIGNEHTAGFDDIWFNHYNSAKKDEAALVNNINPVIYAELLKTRFIKPTHDYGFIGNLVEL